MQGMRARIAARGAAKPTIQCQRIPPPYGQGYALSIDPGVSGTGLALWELKDWHTPAGPIWCQNITPRKGENDWLSRVNRLCDNLEKALGDMELWAFSRADTEDVTGIKVAYMEMPKFFADKAEGEMVAKTGSLTKLAYVAGAIGETMRHNLIEVRHIRVDAWKGTLPKPVVIERIKKRLPRIVKELNPKSHSWDAIGIGLSAKGHFTCSIDKNGNSTRNTPLK